ncbi:MAG: TorD/DmsD family molecular chaperone [Bryobacteraceae bacterium]
MGPEEASAWWAFVARALLSADRDALAELAGSLPPAPGLPTPDELAASLEGDSLDLEREYVRLFLHPDGAPCAPWQSAWAPEPQLMGEAHRLALQWFRRAGIEPKQANEPADHAGLLAAFWSAWLLPGAPASERASFFDQHLAWMDRFATAIASHARHPFYRALAQILGTLLAAARREFSTAPAERPQTC